MMRTYARAAAVAATLSLGCSGPVTPARSASPTNPAVASSVAAPSQDNVPTLPALTADERRWVEPLRRYVTALTAQGSRNVDDPLALADSIDWLSTQLTDEGLAVQRQGFSHGEEVQQ